MPKTFSEALRDMELRVQAPDSKKYYQQSLCSPQGLCRNLTLVSHSTYHHQCLPVNLGILPVSHPCLVFSFNQTLACSPLVTPRLPKMKLLGAGLTFGQFARQAIGQWMTQ